MKNLCIFIFSALFCLSCATDSFGIYHTVKRGENLTKISQLYNINENELRSENSIPEGVDELKEGSAIFIPGAEKVLESEPEEETVPPENTETAEAAEQEPEQKAEPEKTAVQEEKTEVIISEEPETESADSMNFIWPAAGKIVQTFSQSAPKSDGIDIQFEKATDIHAAADGKVIYSASNANFGNMVIIRHDDEFITVYAYLHTIFAKEGQAVKQNDVIGIADATEKESLPTLHFEIRKAAKPVEPTNFLPEN